MRRDIRSQLEARLGDRRPAGGAVPRVPDVGAAASASRVTRVAAAETDLFLPVPPDLAMPAFPRAGLRATYRMEDVSGARLVQANFNHVGQDLVTIDVRKFSLFSRSRAVSDGCFAVQGDRVQTGIYWLNPRVLALLLDEPPAEHPGWDVERTSFDLGGTPVAAIRISQTTKDGFTRHTYEAATGLRLEQVDGSPDNRVELQATHVRRRELRLPWAQEPPPEWVGRVKHLRFEGTNTIVMGDTPVTQRTMLSIDLETLAPGVLLANATTEVELGAAYPSTSTWSMACATAMTYPLWITPAAIRSLTPNQVVDDDPETGFTMTFGGVDRGYATLAEQGPLERTTYYFDVGNGIFSGFRGQRPYSAIGGQLHTETWLRDQR